MKTSLRLGGRLVLLGTAAGAFSAPPCAAQKAHGRSLASIESTVDTTIRPGDDFFGYANGAWLQRTHIPVGKNRWSVRDDINERTRAQIARLLDDASRAKGNTLARKVADFRASLLDDASLNARGMRSIAPLMARIDSIRDRSMLLRYLGATMRADVDPLNFGVYESRSPLGFAVEHSIHGETTYSAFLVQGGLSLGDRDVYLSHDSSATNKRLRLKRHAERLLTLASLEHADLRADSVLALESAIAATHATAQQSASDRNADLIWSRGDFAREAPSLDWSDYFAAASLGRQEQFVIWQPSAVKGFASLVATRSLETWKDYLRFHLLDDFAFVLPRSFAVSAAELRGDGRTRAARALEMTQTSMAWEVAELYARRYIAPAQKERVQHIVSNVAIALRDRVASAEWLSAESRTTALAKLARLYVGIGYPDAWSDWSDLQIDATDALGNVRRLEERERREALARLNRPYDPHEWVMTPHTVGAVLIFQQNAYEFTAALLQAPKYDSTMSDAAAYGSIGALIGHDMSHFVDVLGAEYVTNGAMQHWWTAGDSAAFDRVADPLDRQFSSYEPFPGTRVDGRLTRTENVADLAGLFAAYDAYKRSMGDTHVDAEERRRGDREFFIAFAQTFGTSMNESAMRAQLGTDHAPERYRMNTVRNHDAWYGAFGVKPSDRLYLEPKARIRVW